MTISSPSRAPRILHGTADVAGQASLLARELRARGYHSYSLIYNPTSWRDRPDVMIDTLAVGGWRRAARQGAGLARALPTFDLFHIHFGRSLLYNHLDLPLLHQLGKSLVFHFRGSEIRLQATERRIRELRMPESPPPNRSFCWQRAWRLTMARRYGALILVSTPDLLDVVPEAVHLPVALRLDDFVVSSRPAPRRCLHVAHSPTDPAVKGTRYLEAAVERLRDEGLPIELDIIQHIPQTEVRARMLQADVFVDQLGIGWYGNASVEAMAQGIPTICYIRDDLTGRLGPSPFIQAGKHDIAQALRMVWHDRDLLAVHAERGRRFVEERHEVGEVTRRLIELYDRVRQG